MHRADPLFEDYAHHHRTVGNKWCHRIGIPLIILSLLGMLSIVRFPIDGSVIDAAMILIAIVLAYYLWLGLRLGAAMLIASVLLYLIGQALPFFANVALFAIGWILQFIGHGVYEKRQPAFLRNMVHLLIGPVWILNDLVPLVPRSDRVADPGNLDPTE